MFLQRIGERFCAPCIRKPPNGPSKNLLGTRLRGLCVQGAQKRSSREIFREFLREIPQNKSSRAKRGIHKRGIHEKAKIPQD